MREHVRSFAKDFFFALGFMFLVEYVFVLFAEGSQFDPNDVLFKGILLAIIVFIGEYCELRRKRKVQQ